MCGIAGFLGQNRLLIQNMLKSIKHRGPDDEGIYEDKNITLGHVRLSILDLSSLAHQPMEFDNLVIVFNGEIYNFKEIRDELKDYEFISNSDTEVILKAFHKWREKAVDKFIGMFAFAIYDKIKNEVYIFRDRVGVKPLYYYFDGKNFVFGSELRVITEYYKNLEIDKDNLYDFFRFGYISKEKTIFKNCYKLLPGSYLKLNIKHLKFDIKRYWSVLPFFEKPKFKKTETELVDKLEELLIDAFKYRMVSDVPVGVFLSGGIDSSIVAAILQKHYGNIHTFTIGFKEEKYNEANWAKKVADYLGTKHTEKYLSINEAKEILKDFVKVYDEPFGDSSGIPTILVSKLAKENGVKVVLSADGGDEIFCGYERYWYVYNRGKNILNIPIFIRRIIAKFLDYFPNYRYSYIADIIQSSNWNIFYEKMISSLKDIDVKNLLGFVKEFEFSQEFLIGEKEHPMQGMMLWDYHRYLVDDILVKVDRATMFNSIEGREPMLDHRITEFMAQVPFEYKYKDGKSKYLLRKVLERYLPKELIERSKMGFGIPLIEWFRKDLNNLFHEYFIEDEIINVNYLNIVKNNFKEKKYNNVNLLWFSLVYKMWKQEYIK